jgi:hypothetical protein
MRTGVLDCVENCSYPNRFSGVFGVYCARGPDCEKPTFHGLLLVPGERFELPTNGLQNRCSTTELTRHINDLDGLVES